VESGQRRLATTRDTAGSCSDAALQRHLPKIVSTFDRFFSTVNIPAEMDISA
jgi:hypothetical protein